MVTFSPKKYKCMLKLYVNNPTPKPETAFSGHFWFKKRKMVTTILLNPVLQNGSPKTKNVTVGFYLVLTDWKRATKVLVRSELRSS